MANKDQAKKAKKSGGAKEYFKGIKLEMSKVVWPTKKELGTFTGVVLATCSVFALGFWLIAVSYTHLINWIRGI